MKKNSTYKLLSLIRPHWLIMILGMLALAGGSGINLLFPEVIRRLLNDSVNSWLVHSPIKVGALLLGLFAIQGVFFYLRSLIFNNVGQRVVADLRTALFAKLVRQSVEFFDRERVGDLVSRILSDTQLIQDAVSVKISVFIRYGIQVIAGVTLMACISLKLTLAIIISIPLLVIISIFFARMLKRYTRLQQNELGAATTIASESLSAIKTVSAFAKEAHEDRRFSAAVTRSLAFGLKRGQIAAFFASFVSFLMNGCIVLVLLYGVSLISLQQLSAGDLTAFMLYGAIVAVSFAFISGGYSEFAQSMGAAERVFEMLDLPVAPALKGAAAALTIPTRGEVQFTRVSFSYPTRPEIAALDQVSFTVPAGKMTAVVGPSGSGKTTIVNLILGFYRPTSGVVTFDGRSIAELDPAALRQAIALVPQEPQLFAVSLLDNIRYGRADASLAEIEEACHKANILDFIRSLPEGFETNAGQAGMKFSGGERQRIAIARAILCRPALLIMDEATSALDSQNEAEIQQAINEISRSTTALVIAHRLSTVKSADQLLVFDQGQIVQRGTHASLSQQEGLYRELAEKQKLFSESLISSR